MNELSDRRKPRRKHNTFVCMAAIGCSFGLQSFSSVDAAEVPTPVPAASPASVICNSSMQTFSKMKKTNDAIDHCKLASQLKPSDAYFQERLASILFNQKDYAGSIAAYRKAIQVDPKDSARLGAALKFARAQQKAAGQTSIPVK